MSSNLGLGFPLIIIGGILSGMFVFSPFLRGKHFPEQTARIGSQTDGQPERALRPFRCALLGGPPRDLLSGNVFR